MVREGHEIGNHTATHPRLTDYKNSRRHTTLEGVTKEFLLKELEETERLFRELTAEPMAPLWRAPYGEINAEIRGWAFEAGYTHVGWSVSRGETLDTLDWVKDRFSHLYLSSEEIKDKILNFKKDSTGLRGGIILMHLDSGRPSDRASEKLAEMLDEIARRGYRFVKVSKLIAGKKENHPLMARGEAIANP
jgi:peptidoglycan/xylan/chitin deacetylase (PgdA/CDA1 family)